MNSGKTTTYLSTALIAGGFVLILLAWNGAASFFNVDQQIPYIVSGGLTGLGMVGCGCTLAIIQELRKTGATIAAASAKVAAPDGGGSVLEDTLPEPRVTAGTTEIIRDEEPSEIVTS